MFLKILHSVLVNTLCWGPTKSVLVNQNYVLSRIFSLNRPRSPKTRPSPEESHVRLVSQSKRGGSREATPATQPPLPSGNWGSQNCSQASQKEPFFHSAMILSKAAMKVAISLKKVFTGLMNVLDMWPIVSRAATKVMVNLKRFLQT